MVDVANRIVCEIFFRFLCCLFETFYSDEGCILNVLYLLFRFLFSFIECVCFILEFDIFEILEICLYFFIGEVK